MRGGLPVRGVALVQEPFDLPRFAHVLTDEIDRPRVDVEADEVAVELLALIQRGAASREDVQHGVTLIGVSPHQMVGDLRHEVPVVHVRVLAAAGARPNEPQTADVDVDGLPIVLVDL